MILKEHGYENIDQPDADFTSPLCVLLCPDKPDWAFDNIAKNIKRYCGPNHVFKLFMQDTLDKEHLFFEKILLNKIDVCHIFWREDLFYLLSERTISRAADKLDFSFEELVRALYGCVFTTSVYDHLFSSPAELNARRHKYALIDGYTVSSQKLHSIYTSDSNIPGPDLTIYDGVDLELFKPRSQIDTRKSDLCIGWVGNRAWGEKLSGRDIKGFHRLFQPMMSGLKHRGLQITEKIADPQFNNISFESMPAFYQEMDIFICTSSMEGTPNPVLEAMASGLAIVSTDVGIVSEVFGDLQKRFILKNPSPEDFSAAVLELHNDIDLRIRLGQENRERILDWSWEHKCRDWWPFWKTAMKNANSARSALRREAWWLSQHAMHIRSKATT